MCDDADDMRLLLKTFLLLENDIEVVGEAANGVEGLIKASDLQPDVLVLDLAMPYLDGIQVLRGLPDVAPGTRVVVLSAFERSEMLDRTADLGALDYVEKGADPARVVGSVRAAAGRELAATDGVTRRPWTDPATFRRLFRAAPVGVAVTNAEGRVVLANEPLETFLGYESGEEISCAEVSHPDERDREIRLAHELLAGVRDRYSLHKTCIRRDGSRVRVQVRASAIGVNGGRFRLGIVEGISA